MKLLILVITLTVSFFTFTKPIGAQSEICEQTGELRGECEVCAGPVDNPNGNIWTAIGCFSTELGSMLTDLSSLAVGMGGGFGLLLILYGAFQITMSAGNPERLQAGKDLIISSILGLVFITLSVVLLQFIGFNILRIPGL